MKTSNIKVAEQAITQSYTTIKSYEDIVGRAVVSKLKKIEEEFQKNAKSKEESDRLLRIGIIGQIKRGKSSFLNALFFNNEDILPKAATPMTAALTKIRYAKEPFAEVEFYTRSDFSIIENEAQRAKQKESNGIDLTEEEQVYVELYNKAQQNNILANLGEKKRIAGSIELKEILQELKEYVGGNGLYTPIVKSLELGLDVEALKDIEIIDTPGTNDPVVSRGRKTQEFIGECDVVFVLSAGSQFLDHQDMELLGQNIPSKGIKDIVILCSLFDSLLLDACDDYEDMITLIENLKVKKTKLAQNNIEEFLKKDTLAEVLLNSLPPIYISSMCSNIEKHWENLNKEENYILNELQAMYGDKLTQDDMKFIANIDETKVKIEKIKEHKEEILKSALDNLAQGALQGLKFFKKELHHNVKHELEVLKSQSIVELEEKQKALNAQVQKGEKSIDAIFESYIIEVEKNLKMFLASIKTQKTKASHVNVQRGSYEEEHEREVTKTREADGFWAGVGRFIGIGGYEEYTKTETYYTSITYRYADVYETIEQLEGFAMQSEERLASSVSSIINIEHFRVELQKSIVSIFDMEDDSFDPMEMKRIVKNAINRITIPDVTLDTSSIVDTIRNSFSGQVEDDEINELRERAKDVAQDIYLALKEETEHQTKKIISDLCSIQENFLPELLKDSQEKLERMKASMAQFEVSKKRYEELLEILDKEI